MDAVQQANSSHPGTPMAMAPVAYCLWQKFLRFDPQDPIWPNRDRFVLSMVHASMLLYSMLHLTGGGDANNLDMLSRAFQTFQKTTDRPTLIIVDSHIAWGAPSKQDTPAVHGEPLGEEEIKGTTRNYGWPENETFLVPGEVREHFKQGIARAAKNCAVPGWRSTSNTRPSIPKAMPTLDHSKYASAPLKELQKKFGFTADRIVTAAKDQIAASRKQ